MAANKIIFGNRVLIDLTGDTVTKETLINGVKAHDKTGKIITGTFLKGYPLTLEVEETIEDSSGLAILDKSSNTISGAFIYERK